MVGMTTCTETGCDDKGEEKQECSADPHSEATSSSFPLAWDLGHLWLRYSESCCVHHYDWGWECWDGEEAPEQYMFKTGAKLKTNKQTKRSLAMFILKNNDFLRGFSLSSLHMMSYAYFSTLVNVSNSASELIAASELYLISSLKLVGRLLFHLNMTN